MLSVRGTFRNGVAQPSHPITDHDGQSVIITFLDGASSRSEPQHNGSDWDALDELINDCKIETGISDLAHEHDHYVHAKSKKG